MTEVLQYEKPYEASRSKGCLCCGAAHMNLAMDQSIHPGFGGVSLTRDGERVYPLGEDATFDEEAELLVWAYEAIAQEDSEHDWRLKIDAPLYDATYQRQGLGHWVLIDMGVGFA